MDSEGKPQQKASAHEPDIAANVHEGKKQGRKSMTEQQSKFMLQQEKASFIKAMARRQQQRQAAAKNKSQDATMTLPKPPLFSSAAHQKQWQQHKKSQPKATDQLNLPDVVDSEGKHQQKSSTRVPDQVASEHEAKKQRRKSIDEVKLPVETKEEEEQKENYACFCFSWCAFAILLSSGLAHVQ